MLPKPAELRALTDALVELAPRLRAAGVLEIGDVKFAPMVMKPERIELTPDDLYEREIRIREEQHRTQFAASSIKPILRHPPRSPDSVVQRVVNARERGSGSQG